VSPTRGSDDRFPCQDGDVILGHESGATWDEWLFVLVPLAIFALIVWRAKVRAEHEHEHEDQHQHQHERELSDP
jgi:hypothetical protein